MIDTDHDGRPRCQACHRRINVHDLNLRHRPVGMVEVVYDRESDLARLDQQASEVERLRASPPPAVSQSDLRALVQAQIGAELSRALVRIDARNPDEVEVAFGAVPFDKWLGWVAGLKGQQVRVASSRIEALTSPGLVSVRATLVRAKPR